MESLARSVVSIVEAAGRRVMDVYSGEIAATMKADNSPLTEADLASHEIICDGLRSLDSSIPILSEEAADIPFSERKTWERFWLIDPLDGTKEFIKRTGEFTVNVALLENGIPTLGVVGAPSLGLTYVGSSSGAYRIGGGDSRRIDCSAYRGGVVNVVASRSHAGSETEQWLSRLRERYPEIDLLSIGSSLKLCMVAEGRAHVYPRLGPTMEWDIAAAYAVLAAAGGFVTDMQGGEFKFNKPNLHNPWFLARAPGLDDTIG